MNRKILYLALLCCLFGACKKDNIITQFNPISNFGDKNLVEMDFDMTNGVFEGLSLPNNDSVFEFTFSVSGDKDKKYYYKIFYQNISYAFDDNNKLNSENFYGSWQDTDTEFKLMTSNTVKDSFRIVGNPRNETKYFGNEFPKQITQQDIENFIKEIKNNKKWYGDISKKAGGNQQLIEEQIYKDAIWVLNHRDNEKGQINRRERRNPRVGEYEFMLVVAEEKALEKIPGYIKNISETKDSSFVNPLAYFRSGKGKNIKGVYTFVSDKKLKTRAKFNNANGVYINCAAYPSSDFKIYPDNYRVGNNDSLYRYAQFEQYFHNINTDRYIEQMQLIADIQNDGYTLDDYLKEEKNPTVAKKKIHPCITDYPGKTIRCNNNTIELINPGSQSLENAKKESVGIRARIGFTYGRFIYKIKFPALLNGSGLWNGLTNAAWLIYQSEAEWNHRRVSKKGYVRENYNDNETERLPSTHYSEIDIEMIKTSSYWPAENYKQPPVEEIRKNKNFVLASTNWDLAWDDNNFVAKHLFFEKEYNGQIFAYNRWSEFYRALTSRKEISNDIFNEPFYYYVIEWKPDAIIWYIGKDMQHLNVVGYMSKDFTAIPNNQMIPIITQEYHYSEYWPPVIFDQGLLPYPSKDTKGILYELIVE